MNNSGKGLIKFLVVLVVIAAVLIGGYFIVFRTGKTVGVKSTAADLQSYTDKTGVTFDENSAGYMDYLTGKYKALGSKEVKGFLTQEEVTAIINKTTATDGVFKNFSVKFNADGTAEASFTVGNNIEPFYTVVPQARDYDKFIKMAVGSPVYYKVDLNYLGGNKFQSTSLNAQFGMIPLPIDTVTEQTTPAGTMVNGILTGMAGLKIDKFEIVEGRINFEGTIPTSVVKVP
jgi:hypothetical protein